MLKRIVISGLSLIFSLTIFAQEKPMWIRNNAISPDGTKIAFGYKGDIYVVNVDGSNPVQITSTPDYESDPIWTRDSKNIVYVSLINQKQAVYISPANGGIPKELSHVGVGVKPVVILNDGTMVIKTYWQSDSQYSGFPTGAKLYTVNINGGNVKYLSNVQVGNMSVAADGTIIYEDIKGYEDPFRKHHTSSVTRDIWKYTPAKKSKKLVFDGNGTFTKISDYPGEDRNPVFAADGNTFYYLSERDGKAFNVYQSSLSDPSKVTQLTFVEKDPIRYLSVSETGVLAYSYNGELYTLVPGQKPVKVNITLTRNFDEPDMKKVSFSSGASEFAVSNDGQQIAVIVRGDVFVTSSDYGTTKRITNTPEQERNVCFSNDGRTIYYSSERNGGWGIYKTTLTRKKETQFPYSTDFREEKLTPDDETSFQMQISPDGKWMVYLRNRTELVAMNLKTKSIKSLLKDANYSYMDGDLSFAISPDSKYVLSDYQAGGGWNHPDVALIEIESGKVTNLTQSGYADGNFKWALNGMAMTWQSDKFGYRSHGSWGSDYDIFIMFFNGKTMTNFFKDKEDKFIDQMLSGAPKRKSRKKAEDETADNKVSNLKLDLDNRFNRIVKLTQASGKLGDYYLNPSGTMLYYVATDNASSSNLYSMKIDDGTTQLIARRVNGKIIPSADGNSIYMLGDQGLINVFLGGGMISPISYKADYEYKPYQEREYMFNHVWKQVLEKFYDPEIHGVDWKYYRDNYASKLPYINNNYDFAELLSEMLGELNGSHTGARCRIMTRMSAISYLGFFEDLSWDGKGVKIKEILPDGPINIADTEIKEGDIILSIDGKLIGKGENWRNLLIDKAGKRIILKIKHGLRKKEIVVTPASSEQSLLYKRWVKQREDMVEKLSGGKIGYVHVKGMDSKSYREVFSKALGKYRNCGALIVDTRHNGGGWLHDDLATFLSGKAYLNFQPRGQYISTEPFSKWTKPSCVLICEDNYSDASGFPYVYKTLGIGKLIGAPVPGTMTAVWWETQIDNSIVFGIPQVGSYGLKEKRYLENLQVEPDILVYEDQAACLSGRDVQLEAAVKEMLKEIGNNNE